MKKQILILLDHHCLFKEDEWDPDVIRQLIALLTIFHHEEIIFADRDQKVKNLFLPEELMKNVSFKNDFNKNETDEYDVVIAHYHSEADFFNSQKEGRSFENVYFFNNKSNPNLSFPGIAEYIKQQKLQFDIKSINEKLENFLTLNILPAESEQYEVNITKSEKICIVCDFNQNFFIGDSCFWYYDLNYKLFVLNEKQPSKKIDVYVTSVRNYHHIKRIYSSSFPENVRLLSSSVNSIDFKKYDLVIVEFLLYYNVKNKIENNSQPVLTYTFPIDYEKNKRFHSVAFGKYFMLDDLKRQLLYNKKHYNKIEIKKEEINDADLWLESHGIEKEDKIFALINEASQAEKIIDQKVFLQIIQWLVKEKKYKILLFSQSNDLKNILKKDLKPDIFNKIIFPGKLGIRKEMSLMASDYVDGMLSPCTGLAHLFNGINYYLHNILEKERKKCIVYTGKQTYVDDYHPLSWWNFKYVNCLSYITKNGEAFLAEKKDILTIRNFDEVSLFPNKIPHKILCDKIEEILEN
ncbi:glycosyltransferase family 9 protein [uncultured Chryseobacterium sp.]|uniref:glycosyltransferase family 9 protein n=1 Tax=uncultured Chryseobacterium sp. TaxID=259322 RepID=UPI0037495EBC